MGFEWPRILTLLLLWMPVDMSVRCAPAWRSPFGQTVPCPGCGPGHVGGRFSM